MRTPALTLTLDPGGAWGVSSLDEQMKRDAKLVDEVAFRQKEVFVHDVALFPTEMRYAMDLAR
jgi:hypothetical protein